MRIDNKPLNSQRFNKVENKQNINPKNQKDNANHKNIKCTETIGETANSGQQQSIQTQTLSSQVQTQQIVTKKFSSPITLESGAYKVTIRPNTPNEIRNLIEKWFLVKNQRINSFNYQTVCPNYMMFQYIISFELGKLDISDIGTWYILKEISLIEKMPNLSTLRLNKNHIKNVEALAFIDLSKVKYISLASNEIVSFMGFDKLKLEKLSYVILDKNPLRLNSFNRMNSPQLEYCGFEVERKRRKNKIPCEKLSFIVKIESAPCRKVIGGIYRSEVKPSRYYVPESFQFII